MTSKKATTKSKPATKKSGSAKASTKTKPSKAGASGNPRMMEKLMRDINRALEGREFASTDEMNAFINENFVGKKIGTMPIVGQTPLEQAQDKIFEAYDEPDDERRSRLAREALALSPDCADAYILLAEGCDSAAKALKLYEQGVEAGKRAIGEREFRDMKGSFWGFVETRPYMRARLGLAECLWQLGRRDQAVEHYETLLQLNPNDNQGVRYILAGALLAVGKDGRLAELLQTYKDDAAAAWVYTRALLAFRREGDTAASRRLLKAAMKQNPFIPMYIVAVDVLPPPPEYVGFGDPNEAVAYIYDSMENWLETPGAIEWMLDTLAGETRRPSIARSARSAKRATKQKPK